jgi:hypothetical protein
METKDTVVEVDDEEEEEFTSAKSPRCHGSDQVLRRDLPPLLKNGIGVRQADAYPAYDGVGWVQG